MPDLRGEWSATKGDYWFLGDDEVMECEGCAAALVLGRRVCEVREVRL